MNNKVKQFLLGILLGIFVTLTCCAVYVLYNGHLYTCEDSNDEYDGVTVDKKPVIYVYSDIDDKYVEISLYTKNDIICEYPKRNEDEIWRIIANTDGTIEDVNSNMTYNYLYWEGKSTNNWDFSQGFCIKGTESREFLEKTLEEIGLNRKEANEFIVYWLPQLEENEYNLISFQTDRYTEEYELRVHPHCDNMLRVFMAYKGLNEPIEIEEQNLEYLKGDFKREGLHIVEWGGSRIE